MKTKKRKKKRYEYSKIVIGIFMASYIIGILIGIYAVVVQPDVLEALLVYIGGSSTIATSFYFWKARCENIIKLSKENPDFDFSTIGIDNGCEE